MQSMIIICLSIVLGIRINDVASLPANRDSIQTYSASGKLRKINKLTETIAYKLKDKASLNRQILNLNGEQTQFDQLQKSSIDPYTKHKLKPVLMVDVMNYYKSIEQTNNEYEYQDRDKLHNFSWEEEKETSFKNSLYKVDHLTGSKQLFTSNVHNFDDQGRRRINRQNEIHNPLQNSESSKNEALTTISESDESLDQFLFVVNPLIMSIWLPLSDPYISEGYSKRNVVRIIPNKHSSKDNSFKKFGNLEPSLEKIIPYRRVDGDISKQLRSLTPKTTGKLVPSKRSVQQANSKQMASSQLFNNYKLPDTSASRSSEQYSFKSRIMPKQIGFGFPSINRYPYPYPQSIAGSDLSGAYAIASVGPNGFFGGMPVVPPIEEPIEGPEEPVEEPVEEPIEEPEEPVVEPVEEPEVPVEEPSEEPVVEPVVEPVEGLQEAVREAIQKPVAENP